MHCQREQGEVRSDLDHEVHRGCRPSAERRNLTTVTPAFDPTGIAGYLPLRAGCLPWKVSMVEDAGTSVVSIRAVHESGSRMRLVGDFDLASSRPQTPRSAPWFRKATSSWTYPG